MRKAMEENLTYRVYYIILENNFRFGHSVNANLFYLVDLVQFNMHE